MPQREAGIFMCGQKRSWVYKEELQCRYMSTDVMSAILG